MRILDTKIRLRSVRACGNASSPADQEMITTGNSHRHSSTEMQLNSGKPDRSPRPVQPGSKEKSLPKLKNPDQDRETVLRLIRRIKEQQV